jgi:predicted transcriptional regulator
VIVKSKLEENVANNIIIEKYFQNRHVLLIYLASKEGVGKRTTVIDIVKAFHITKKYAWTLLEKLENDNLIKKSEKITKEGLEYHSYIITEEANRDLKMLSLCLNSLKKEHQ